MRAQTTRRRRHRIIALAVLLGFLSLVSPGVTHLLPPRTGQEEGGNSQQFKLVAMWRLPGGAKDIQWSASPDGDHGGGADPQADRSQVKNQWEQPVTAHEGQTISFTVFAHPGANSRAHFIWCLIFRIHQSLGETIEEQVNENDTRWQRVGPIVSLHCHWIVL